MSYSYDPAKGFPGVVVELVYRDVGAAVDWLSRVFGFRELLRMTWDDGTVGHADMDTGHGVVMLAAEGGDRRSPAADEQVCKHLVVFVDDVDRHFERAKAEGAVPVHDPVDKPWGLRQYLARDPEGHTWEFTEHLRDVRPEEWGAVAHGYREDP